MPFQSESQRRYLWSQHPDIAEAWAHGRSSKTGKKEPSRNTKGHRGATGGYRKLPRHKNRKSGRS